FSGKAMIVPPRDGHNPTQPSLAFDGDSLYCSYLDNGAVNLMRVDPLDLNVTELAPVTNSGALRPSIAAAHGRGVVAWARDAARINNLGIGGAAFAESIEADGSRSAFPISVAAHDQTLAASASNGTDILVVWNEGNSQQVSLMGGFLHPDGSWREL